MSQGVEKDTYVEADERTTKALTYDLLNSLSVKIDMIITSHSEQLIICNNRFKNIEKSKKKNTAISGFTGLGGGFIAMIVYYIREWIKN